MLSRTKLLTVLALAVVSLGVTACETVDGAGRDIEKAGEAVQKASH